MELPPPRCLCAGTRPGRGRLARQGVRAGGRELRSDPTVGLGHVFLEEVFEVVLHRVSDGHGKG